MNVIETLRAIARGERPSGALLPSARLAAFGIEAYGEEAIVASFRRQPLALPAKPDTIQAPGHLALFDGETALFADLYGDNIGRLWRLGPGDPMEGEPGIGVPFDPDLVQARGDIALRAEDHPALALGALGAVEAIGTSIARSWSPDDGASPYRTRAFALRAFNNGNDGAALFAVHRLGPEAVRTTGFAYASARFRIDNGVQSSRRIVRDQAGEAAVTTARWQSCIG